MNKITSNNIARLPLLLNISLTLALVVLIGMMASKMAYAQFNRPMTIVVIATVTTIVINVLLSISKRLLSTSTSGRASRAKD